MRFFLIPITLILLILFVARFFMQRIRDDDRKNGLKLDKKEYTIRKTILSSNKQEKRLEKILKEKQTFKEYTANDEKLKKYLALSLVIMILGIPFAIILKAGLPTLIICIMLTIWIYSSKSIKVVIFQDVFILLSLLYESKYYHYIIVIPVSIFVTYLISSKYILFRKEKNVD